MVKEKFRALTQGCTCPPDLPVCACGAKASFAPVTPQGDQRRPTPRWPRTRGRGAPGSASWRSSGDARPPPRRADRSHRADRGRGPAPRGGRASSTSGRAPASSRSGTHSASCSAITSLSRPSTTAFASRSRPSGLPRRWSGSLGPGWAWLRRRRVRCRWRARASPRRARAGRAWTGQSIHPVRRSHPDSNARRAAAAGPAADSGGAIAFRGPLRAGRTPPTGR